MSTDSYTPREYAEIASDRASNLRIDLADGALGRANMAEVMIREQLIGAGMDASRADEIPADFLAQLRKIDEAAHALTSAYDRLPDVVETMESRLRKEAPGFQFSHWTV